MEQEEAEHKRARLQEELRMDRKEEDRQDSQILGLKKVLTSKKTNKIFILVIS